MSNTSHNHSIQTYIKLTYKILTTVVDVSLASSQFQIPFSITPGALTIYHIIQCGQAKR